MNAQDDQRYMRRCLELASCAAGMTYPNPLVGSVIVHDNRIIGEGYHLKAGGPHAEVNAVKSVRQKEVPAASALYVNLEPCSHFGLTPPCTDLIISSGIRKVVVGTIDTSEKVSGKGIQKLMETGCEVLVGVLEEECRMINRRFFTFHEKRRPYIFLKWAQSSDGFLDMERERDRPREPVWITGSAEKVLVHRWRAEEQAILAGAETVRKDDPKLNVREWTGNDPLKLILSSSGNPGSSMSVLASGGRVIVFTHNKEARIPGAEMYLLDRRRESCRQIADFLYGAGIQSLFVEGGAEVLTHFISNGLWDEARVFTGRKPFNRGVRAPLIDRKLLSEEVFDQSTLKLFYNDGMR
ncbi:MAG: bifunctional diaminohydroxyphosphoribosylaminopyrimidine deaminase/5-amino-6-(5-phosphoribosylamino)uracil reductase RibD [Bacteroidales bacterium]|nr:bifunctional diaminohydroxyphosphoribosylaminopyrimidine deaminase/5-amino-6-(5-phosphoribosylamino)uracil reductase RibD [Bacteroidales bacterium]